MGTSRVPALLVLAATLLLAGWMGSSRENGPVVPEGTSTMAYGGRPARLVSVFGHRLQPPDEPSASFGAYHVLVTFAADSVTSVSTSAGGSDLHHALSDAWKLWDGAETGQEPVVSITAGYDPVRQRVEIGGRRFSLARGNLFVVRYDAAGNASVRQLPRTVYETDPLSVTHAFQALLPADPVVRDLFRGTVSGPAAAVPTPATRRS